MTPIEKIIHDQIKQGGPMGVDRYMELCLNHAQHGYYHTRDPFGAAGDFITAPEVSQMFGEMIGVWLIDTWSKLGEPEQFSLVECGPGRGTLMADILRTCIVVPELLGGAELFFLESSAKMRARQQETLASVHINFIDGLDGLDGVAGDKPVILLANEFLDALPIRQAQKTAEGWQERCIVREGDNEGDKLAFGFGDKLEIVQPGQRGDIFEFSPARERFVKHISELLKNTKGAALLIDYGHNKTACGDTLQAVRAHDFAPPLERPGEADITSHVDFEALQKVSGVSTAGPVTQAEFLRAMGIDTRLTSLVEKFPDKQDQLGSQYHRLTGRSEMGALFKVMALYEGIENDLAGF